jgi:hypothetical protein
LACFDGSSGLPEKMSEGFDALRLLPASTPESFGTTTVQPANMSGVLGNISGLPEKMPGNSGHPPAFHSGRPENFAGISARRFNGVEHQRFSVVGERRAGVIATGVFRECRQLSESRWNLSSPKILLPESQSACRDSKADPQFRPKTLAKNAVFTNLRVGVESLRVRAIRQF